MEQPASSHRMRLSTRMAMLSLAMLLVVQVASFGAIRLSIERNARRQLEAQLDVGARIWQRLLEQRAAQLTQAASVLAADFGFRSAVGSGDNETIVSALDNHGARIGAGLAALLDSRYAVKAVAHDGAAGSAAGAVLAQIGTQLGGRGVIVATVDGRPMQFVMVPLRAPLLIGHVVMGFELDAAPVVELQAVSGLHASLVATDASGAGRLLQSSAAPDSPVRELALSADAAGASQWIQRSVPVVSGGSNPVLLQLTGSVAQAIEPYRDLQWFLAGLTALGLLLFGCGSAWSARRVTRPLSSLASASEGLGRGEYDVPVAHTGRGDEIGDLARAFESMRVNIAASQLEITTLAYADRLTGLPNRLAFRDAVVAAMARHDGGPEHIAVVMLDLDRFKHVNDVLGYATGDRLLQGVAERLRQVVRDGDRVARLGGDEFALLLPNTDARLAGAIAERIAAVFATPMSLDDQTIDLSASVGIACWPDHASEPDVLISRAEVAMYAAKRRTTGAMVYEDALDNGSAQTLSLLGELRRAVEQDELRLFLQPKIATRSRLLCGAEALVRWQHPTRGLVPPMEFIPFAEQTGFVRHLTMWMFEQAASLIATLQELGVERVSINLSTRDLMDLELPDKLDRILTRHGVSASAFCLEITESAIMDDPQRAEATINRLAARGFKLSIDDFGTGYSSLAYLKRLPVNELKIDKSFVMGMADADGEGDTKIVRSTIDLAHNLGLSVVAEGVENAATLRRLEALGCDEAQGYHLSKPLPWVGFLGWAKQWSARPLPAAADAAPQAAVG